MTEPLDLGYFVEEPCDLLTFDQLVALRVYRPERLGIPNRVPPTKCFWQIDRGAQQVSVRVYPAANRVADFYADPSTNDTVFDALAIAGYPAATRKSEPRSQSCDVTVAVAPTQSLELDYSAISAPTMDVCAAGAAVLDTMIDNIRTRPPG